MIQVLIDDITALLPHWTQDTYVPSAAHDAMQGTIHEYMCTNDDSAGTSGVGEESVPSPVKSKEPFSRSKFVLAIGICKYFFFVPGLLKGRLSPINVHSSLFFCEDDIT